jgi:hypothetical protein
MNPYCQKPRRIEEVRRTSKPDPIPQLTGQGIAIEITKDNVPHDLEKSDRGKV